MPDGDQFWKHWGATEALEQGAADRHASLLLGRIVVIALLHCDCSAGTTGIVHVFLWGPDPFPSASAVTCHATYKKKKKQLLKLVYICIVPRWETSFFSQYKLTCTCRNLYNYIIALCFYLHIVSWEPCGIFLFCVGFFHTLLPTFSW